MRDRAAMTYSHTIPADETVGPGRRAGLSSGGRAAAVDLARVRRVRCRASGLESPQRPAARLVCVATRSRRAGRGRVRPRQRPPGGRSDHRPPKPDALSLQRTLLLKLRLHDGDVIVDPQARVARIKAGARWGDVVDTVRPRAGRDTGSCRRSASSATCWRRTVFYGRRHGLAVNHVKAFEVVTPDGIARHVDADHNRDLFYALAEAVGATRS